MTERGWTAPGKWSSSATCDERTRSKPMQSLWRSRRSARSRTARGVSRPKASLARERRRARWWPTWWTVDKSRSNKPFGWSLCGSTRRWSRSPWLRDPPGPCTVAAGSASDAGKQGCTAPDAETRSAAGMATDRRTAADSGLKQTNGKICQNLICTINGVIIDTQSLRFRHVRGKTKQSNAKLAKLEWVVKSGTMTSHGVTYPADSNVVVAAVGLAHWFATFLRHWCLRKSMGERKANWVDVSRKFFFYVVQSNKWHFRSTMLSVSKHVNKFFCFIFRDTLRGQVFVFDFHDGTLELKDFTTGALNCIVCIMWFTRNISALRCWRSCLYKRLESSIDFEEIYYSEVINNRARFVVR